jgi:hypothetical protein
MMKRIILLFICLFLIISLAGCGSGSSNVVAQSKPVDDPKAVTTAPPFDFTTADPTKENITEAISEVIPQDQITSLTITAGVVTIHYNPGGSLSEDMFYLASAVTDTNAFEILYSNPKISKSIIWTQGKLTDAKGNDTVVDLMQVTLLRENEKDINWKGFKDLVMANPDKLFAISDDAYIHPAISKGLSK